MTLYGCYVTDCMETWQESLHVTKRGAWKAGNKWLNARHNDSFNSRALIGKSNSDFMTDMLHFKVLPVTIQE